MPKKYEFYLLTKLLDIDIDIAIFCKYRIDIVSKLKKWYRYSSITRTRYHRVGHIFITFIYSLAAIRDFLPKYLIAFTFSGLSENASHICRNPASVSYTSVGSGMGTTSTGIYPILPVRYMILEWEPLYFCTFSKLLMMKQLQYGTWKQYSIGSL